MPKGRGFWYQRQQPASRSYIAYSKRRCPFSININWTILGTYFTVSPIDLIPTVYKLSKKNIYIIQNYERKAIQKLIALYPIAKARGFTAILR